MLARETNLKMTGSLLNSFGLHLLRGNPAHSLKWCLWKAVSDFFDIISNKCRCKQPNWRPFYIVLGHMVKSIPVSFDYKAYS